MNNLTNTERSVLDNLSAEHSQSVRLGAKIQELIDSIGMAGTPVNAVSAEATLSLTGVVTHGERVTIGNDIYEFSTNSELPLSSPSNLRIDISASAVKASGTLTLTDQPVSGNTMTIGEKVYTFVPVGTDTADGEISIGSDLAEAKNKIVDAINGVDGINLPHALVTASDFVADSCTITAKIGGAAGNSIATTETFGPVGNVFSSTKLGSGASCSAANGATALASAVEANAVSEVSANKVNSTVVLTAKVAGVSGNAINVSKTMANAAFNGSLTKLAGGVDGTTAPAGRIMVDADYLYVTISQNTVSGKNWRRIQVGSAF